MIRSFWQGKRMEARDGETERGKDGENGSPDETRTRHPDCHPVDSQEQRLPHPLLL